MPIDLGKRNSSNTDLTAEFFEATLMNCGALH